MKILTKEQEQQHYNETLKGGTLGLLGGGAVGAAGVYLASQRYHFVRSLTLPLKAFLVTSSGTFAGIISADHWSRNFEQARNPLDVQHKEQEAERKRAEIAGKTFTERAMDFGRKERYKIVLGSWVGSMFFAWQMVNRDKHMSGAQKIVQARVYAQSLTVGVLIATAAFEIADSKNQEGRYETVRYIDPKDPEHKRMLEKQVEKEGGKGAGAEHSETQDQWKEMMEAEEERLRVKEEHERRFRKEAEAKHHKKGGKEKKDDHKDEGGKKDDGKKEDSNKDGKDKK